MSSKQSSTDSQASARRPVASKFVFVGTIPKSFDMVEIQNSASSLPLAVGEDIILFSFGYPYAVRTGSVVYFPDVGRRPATTKAINALSPEVPHVRLGPPAYDSVLATVLTKAGMILQAQT
jgi:hypothetical protein